MKKIAFLIGFIVISLGALHVFALPPLLNFVLKTEINKRGFTIVSEGEMHLGTQSFALVKPEISKKNISIALDQLTIHSPAITTLIQRKANKITLQSPYIFIDTTSDAYKQSYGETPFQSFLSAPHKLTRELLRNTLEDLQHIAPIVSLNNIKVDIFTPDGLISLAGDITITKGQILGSFSSAQKQMTINAKIDGVVDGKGNIINIKADNINIDLPNVELRRGVALFNYKDKQGLPSTNLEIKASLAHYKSLTLSGLDINAQGQKNEHKIHVNSLHGTPQNGGKFMYWHNIQEGITTTYLQSDNSNALDIIALYDPSAADLRKYYGSLLNNFFLDTQDIIIQGQNNGKSTDYRASFLARNSGQLIKATAQDNGNILSLQMDNTPITPTQIQALSAYFMPTPLYNFSGDVQLYGAARINKQQPQRILPPADTGAQPLGIALKKASFKSNTTQGQNINGQLKLAEGVIGTISFDKLSNNGLNLTSGRMNIIRHGHHQFRLDQLRANMGTGQVTITQKQGDTYLINGRRVNAKTIPDLFWPAPDALQQLVNFDIKANLNDAQKPMLNAEFLVIANNQKSRKNIDTRKLDNPPAYLTLLGYAP